MFREIFTKLKTIKTMKKNKYAVVIIENQQWWFYSYYKTFNEAQNVADTLKNAMVFPINKK